MAERYLLEFRAAQGDMTFSCVVWVEGSDELKGDIECWAMILEKETGRPWVCEVARPFPEKVKEGRKDG